jgi:DNA-binding NarL/FixJ family response regulator
MSGSNPNDRVETEPVDLAGIRVLVVEDSWQLGVAMRSLLQAYGAEVSGPVATAADAERLCDERVPDVALVDFNLRGGELANALIDRLHGRGIHIIVTSGYSAPPVSLEKVAAILQKPIGEARLIESMRPVAARKSAQ